MKDRISLYPGRVKLTPVSGQTNVYDLERADEPLQEGTPLNRDTLLSAEVASFLGLAENATPSEALKILAADLVYEDINESCTWTVPEDLVGGILFAMVVGGGGSGGGGYSSYNAYGGGGGSGHIAWGTLSVTPGQQIQAIIGAGGTITSNTGNGSNGGQSSFGSLVANGGSCGERMSKSGSVYRGSGGDGGAGGGASGSSGAKNGGNGSFGGGGGSGRYDKYANNGGNGGTFGGGGGNVGSLGGPGTGGSYGGNGASNSTSTPAGAGTPYKDSFKLWDLAARHYGITLAFSEYKSLPGEPNSASYNYAGGGGYGGNGGKGIGGGGGYCAHGSSGDNSLYTGAGGLFFGNGVDNAAGGFFADGNSQLRGAGARGLSHGDKTLYSGGNGVIGIWYYKSPGGKLNAFRAQ